MALIAVLSRGSLGIDRNGEVVRRVRIGRRRDARMIKRRLTQRHIVGVDKDGRRASLEPRDGDATNYLPRNYGRA